MTQSIKTLLKFLTIVFPFYLQAQSSHFSIGSKEQDLIDRLEIKSRTENLSFSFVKPYSTKMVTEEFLQLDSLQRNQNRLAARITKFDRYNITQLLMDNKEWTPRSSSFNNKKNYYNIIEVNKPKFFFTANPVFQYRQTFESDNDKTVYTASAGVKLKGLIAKQFGFDFYMSGNQERTPVYVQQWTRKFNAVPGYGNFNYNKDSAVRYYDVRGSINFKVTRFIDVQAGYDRNFLGNGYRSLLMSDFSGNALFFKLNTRMWKFNLENLYMQLTPQTGIVNQKNEKKYLRINTLSFNATRWLNIGIFDAVVFGRKNQFELSYILPITFLRAMEQQAGSPDNAILGLNIKANIAGKFQLYSQLVLDEFLLSEMKKNDGYWANKFGYQLGVKYVDAFDVKNLDLQIEVNRMRPFTYTHFDSVSNYTHANQPLAHPAGAGFQEYILIAKYQALKKLKLTAKAIYYYQGYGANGSDVGINIFTNYRDRGNQDYGWFVGGGDKGTTTYLFGNATYEVIPNLYLDGGVSYRSFKLASANNKSSTMFNIGFRWNIDKIREFDF